MPSSSIECASLPAAPIEQQLTRAERREIEADVRRLGIAKAARSHGMTRSSIASLALGSARMGTIALWRSLRRMRTEAQPGG